MQSTAEHTRIIIVSLFALMALVALSGCRQEEPPVAGDAADSAKQGSDLSDTTQASPTEAQDATSDSEQAAPEGGGEGDSLPYAIQLLSPAYREAYRLFPTHGEWSSKFIATEFAQYTPERLEGMSRGARAASVPPPTPQFDSEARIEFFRVVRYGVDAEWLIERIRALDSDSAATYLATTDIAERIDVFQELVEVKGKEDGVYEILIGWKARQAGWSETQIAEFLANDRADSAETRALMRLAGQAFVERYLELRVCDFLMWQVVGEHPREARAAPAECDIAKVIALTEQSLKDNGGRLANSEEYYRQQVEFAAQTP